MIDLLGWALQGRASVAVFIVLSGYLLMMPVLASGGGIAGGTQRYLLRRARRILPPYYAALALVIVATWGFPALRTPVSVEWSASQPALSASAILSHLFLVHNLSASTVLKIDPPMWTIATEWQLYFVFPFILLPLWRVAGGLVTVGISLAGTLALVAVTGRGTSAAPWFAGLFAMGMTAATFRNAAAEARVTRLAGVACGTLATLYLAVTAVCSLTLWREAGGIESQYHWFWAADIAVGAATACGLVYLTARGRASVTNRLLSTAPLISLGIVSYSLYLIHDPILAGVTAAVRSFGWSPWTNFALLATAGVPITIAAAVLFHVCFERPFLSRRALARVEAESGRNASGEASARPISAPAAVASRVRI